MPGILHETAVKKAVHLLGPGAATTGFREELRSWARRACEISSGAAFGFEDDDIDPCDVCGSRGVCEHRIRMMIEDEVPRARVIPDAFRIHTDHPRCSLHDALFMIDVIEIDGSSTLRKKINRWLEFGADVETAENSFLRLRIFNEHFVQIGEYTEEDLFDMWIQNTAKAL